MIARGGITRTVEPSYEHVHFATDDVLLGQFRCAPTDPGFAGAGLIRNYVVAFPRTAVWIEREHEAPFVADPGVATVYNRGDPYERRMISAEGDRSEWFAVSEAIARDVVRAHNPADADRDRPLPCTHASVPARVYRAQRELFARVRDASDALEIEERTITIVAEVIGAYYRDDRHHRTTPAPLAAKRRRALVEEAKALLMATLGENPSVAATARQLRVSPFHLCRTFRALTGFTLGEYRREMRLRTALGLAPEFRGKLSVLAVQLGFYSHAHFSAAFRATFGTSPSAPRAMA